MSIIRTVKMIDCSDWDALVEETYGRTYCFQQQDGCKSRGVEDIIATLDTSDVWDYEVDSVPEVVNGDEMGVSFAAWLARDPKQKLDSGDEWDRQHGLGLWWNRNFYPTAESVAHDLCKRGLLEEGEYKINIDW